MNTDSALKKRLMSYARDDRDYWSFRGKAVREHAHAYLQYPAMMVPQMQGELIKVIREFARVLKKCMTLLLAPGQL